MACSYISYFLIDIVSLIFAVARQQRSPLCLSRQLDQQKILGSSIPGGYNLLVAEDNLIM
jgi:hypothetical protein